MKEPGCKILVLIFLISYNATVYVCWKSKTPELECPDYYTSGNTERLGDNTPINLQKPIVHRYNKDDPFYAGFWPGVLCFGPIVAIITTLIFLLAMLLFEKQFDDPEIEKTDDSTGFAPYKR